VRAAPVDNVPRRSDRRADTADSEIPLHHVRSPHREQSPCARLLPGGV